MTHEKPSPDTRRRLSTDPDGSDPGLGRPRSRRNSALDQVPTFTPPPGLPGLPVSCRRSTASQTSSSPRLASETDEIARPEDMQELVAVHSASSPPPPSSGRRWSRHADCDSHDTTTTCVDDVLELPTFPRAAKPGPVSCAIREVPSAYTPTPQSTRPPSPGDTSGTRTPTGPAAAAEYEVGAGQAYPDIGTIASFRGAILLFCTCGAQCIDNVFMTGVNIALPTIQKDLHVKSSDLQWLISAYTLTFGGFLLLSGVLADRFGRKLVFCTGMAALSLWSIANGLAPSFIHLSVFRALQGIAAALTVPSAVGIISNYFVARDRTRALTIFGAAGAVGFCLGLVFGGFLTSSPALGWRSIFYIPVAVTATIGLVGWFALPSDRVEGSARPKLDFAGAALSTAGLILLSFVLSSGGEYGWGKALIVGLLVVSIGLIVAFTWVEKKVANPIMPLSLWKLENFAALWIGGFVMYGGYQTTIYYTTLLAQQVTHLSAGETAIRFLPMGATGFVFSISMSRMLDMFNPKWLLAAGMAICAVAPVPAALINAPPPPYYFDNDNNNDYDDINFWKFVFPTTVISVAGTTIVYCTITVVLLASVPVNVKSLCGGMVNTAFQIGSGFGLAVASAVVQAVDTNKGHGLRQQYATGLWCCVGLAGVGLVASIFGVKNVGRVVNGPVMAH